MWFPNLQVHTHTHTCTPQDKREKCLLRCLPEMKFYDWSKIIFNSQKKSENKSQNKNKLCNVPPAKMEEYKYKK